MTHPIRRHSALRPRGAAALALAALLLTPACGGGGGGGGPGGDSSGGGGGPGGGGAPTTNGPQDFFLQSAYVARPILSPEGQLLELIHPSSLYEVDPVTGEPLPGYPKPLTPGIDLGTLVPINFAQILDAITPQVPLVARNAAIVLQFSFPVDPESLHLDDSDPAAPGQLTTFSPLQVRRADGSFVDARAVVDGKRITLFAQSSSQAGWEASPLVFDTFGIPVEDPEGVLRIVMGDGVGPLPLLSTSGSSLVPREPDHLGSLAVPLPFNPGNTELDPLALQTEAGAIHFNGFLPDLTPPRIVRPVVRSGTVFDAAETSITAGPLDPPANTVANGGDGEWAHALLEVTDSDTLEVTRYVVERNVSALVGGDTLPVFLIEDGLVDPSVGAGDTYVVSRTEYFEPIPPPLPTDPTELAAITVDPVSHPRDPLDAQDLINHDLRYFVRMYDEAGVERTDVWDPSANLFGPVPGQFGPIPPRTTLRMQFSEPMEPSSFRPYETFYITDLSLPKTDPALQRQRPGRTVASADLRTISFEPFLEDQFDPDGSKFIGFGGTPTSLKLVLRTIPEVGDLQALLAGSTSQQLAQYVDLDTTGVLGVIDLGGRGVGLPKAMLDSGDPNFFLLQPASPGRGAYAPAVDLSVGFQTQPSEDPEFGAIVHRFMGQATSATFFYPSGTVHDEVTTGVEYHDWPPEDSNNDGTIDRRFIYGPRLLDIGLNLPGQLTGAPGSTIEHVVDDHNAPKPAPFSSPQGQDILPTIGFGVKVPINSPFGCRFQQVFRQGEASPSFFDFNGVMLDLVGLAWAPIGNNVANETIEAMGIMVGLTAMNNTKGPNTNAPAGIPQGAQSGLLKQYDCNLLEWKENCNPPNTNIPPDLEPYVASQPHKTEVIRRGTPYAIANSKLFKPANAQGKPPGQYNLYLNYPTFNSGVDTTFGKDDVKSFPYDSRFPMIVEIQVEPAVNTMPTNLNVYRYSPATFSSVLPRFRIWSQGQHPLANCIPAWNQACPPANPIPCGLRAGEGGPLVEPGTVLLPIKPPFPHNNNMPTIFPSSYILPPIEQPVPDAKDGTCPSPMDGLGYKYPVCNSNPYMNWYFANGMQAFPLPNVIAFTGPTGIPPTNYYGYGMLPPLPTPPPDPPIFLPPLAFLEPAYNCDPGTFGDNSRYYMMWKYRKRVSIIESPTVQAQSVPFGLFYQHPIIDPPLSTVSEAAGLRVEFRSSAQLDFATPQLASAYLLPTDPDFQAELSGSNFDRVFVKFKATFAVATGLLQPPAIDTIVLPYERLQP